jgi:uracil-DNA glycosylase
LNTHATGSNQPSHHPLNYAIHSDWQPLFATLSEQQWFTNLLIEISHAYDQLEVTPTAAYLWRTFELTSLSNLKGILLGQDPYPNPLHANGLAFSTQAGITIPASLRSIFFELERTHQISVSKHGDLSKWASQGLLLLNSTLVLDVATKKPPTSINSENWQKLTTCIMEFILAQNRSLFVLAMGKKAQKAMAPFLTASQLHIISTPHPSPLATIGIHAKPFVGCNCFVQIDSFLRDQQQTVFDWNLNS